MPRTASNSFARTRSALLLLLMLSPLMFGAYRSACNRSAGVWPNYGAGLRGGSDAAALEYTDGKGIGHIMLFVGWEPKWYDCSKSPCVFKGNTNGRTDLQNFVYDGIKSWAGKNYGRQYNVNIVLNVHQAYGSSQVGPSSVVGTGTLAGSTTVTSAFNAFYDQIYGVMKLPDFRDTADDTWTNIGAAAWMISIGNEVDMFMATQTDWTEYAKFAVSANNYIKSASGNSQGLTVLTGVTQTYYGSALPNQSNGSAPSVALHAIGDAVNLTYYPFVNCGLAPTLCPNTGKNGGVRMADPGQATRDFQVMATYLATVNAKRSSLGFSQSYVFLQEVGYPTKTGGVAAGDWACPDSAGASCNPTSSTSTLETYQAQFVDKVFAAFNASPSVFRALTWWSLFDYTSYGSGGCSPYWPANSTRFCYMGLRHGDNTAKPAYTNFVTQVANVQ